MAKHSQQGASVGLVRSLLCVLIASAFIAPAFAYGKFYAVTCEGPGYRVYMPLWWTEKNSIEDYWGAGIDLMEEDYLFQRELIDRWTEAGREPFYDANPEAWEHFVGGKATCTVYSGFE